MRRRLELLALGVAYAALPVIAFWAAAGGFRPAPADDDAGTWAIPAQVPYCTAATTRFHQRLDGWIVLWEQGRRGQPLNVRPPGLQVQVRGDGACVWRVRYWSDPALRWTALWAEQGHDSGRLVALTPTAAEICHTLCSFAGELGAGQEGGPAAP